MIVKRRLWDRGCILHLHVIPKQVCLKESSKSSCLYCWWFSFPVRSHRPGGEVAPITLWQREQLSWKHHFQQELLLFIPWCELSTVGSQKLSHGQLRHRESIRNVWLPRLPDLVSGGCRETQLDDVSFWLLSQLGHSSHFCWMLWATCFGDVFLPPFPIYYFTPNKLTHSKAQLF